MARLTEDAHDIVTKLAKKCYQDIIPAYDLAEYNIRPIESGFGRAVYSLPEQYINSSNSPTGYVVKFPEPSMHEKADGKEQNRQEIKAWEDSPADYRDYLVPIIDYHPDNWWIVMPHVETIDTDSPEGQQRLDELEAEGFEFEDEVELGRFEGEILLLDYGYKVRVAD